MNKSHIQNNVKALIPIIWGKLNYQSKWQKVKLMKNGDKVLIRGMVVSSTGSRIPFLNNPSPNYEDGATHSQGST